MRAGETVAIAGPPRSEWFQISLGVQIAGGISVGVYPRQSRESLAHLLGHSRARVFFASEVSDLETALEVVRAGSAPRLRVLVNGIGTLDERFTFDDGEQQERVWKLKPLGDGSYSATAGDVVGEAALQVAGNSLFLDYVLRVPYGGDTIDVRIDDRMYLVSERVLLNESIMTKWGFEVGQITLVIEKE